MSETKEKSSNEWGSNESDENIWRKIMSKQRNINEISKEKREKCVPSKREKKCENETESERKWAISNIAKWYQWRRKRENGEENEYENMRRRKENEIAEKKN